MTVEAPLLTPVPDGLDPEAKPLEAPRRPHTSYSQLDTYARCSLRHFLKYHEKWPDPMNLNLVRGKAGHQALEADHRHKIRTGQNLPHEALLAKFSDAYDAFATEIEPENLEPGDDIGKAKDATAATLDFYFARTGPKIRPVLVEHEFNLDIEPTEAYPEPIRIVNGRIDLVEATGVYDNKFPKGPWGAKERIDVDYSWQLTLYDIVMSRMGIEVPHLGLIQFLPPNDRNGDGAKVQTTRRSPGEMEPEQRDRRRARLLHVLAVTEKEIAAGNYKPADNPKVCQYCPYRKPCHSSLAKDDFARMAN